MLFKLTEDGIYHKDPIILSTYLPGNIVLTLIKQKKHGKQAKITLIVGDVIELYQFYFDQMGKIKDMLTKNIIKQI